MIVRMRYRLSQQSILSGCFILRSRHQRLVDQPDSRRDRPLHAGDRNIEIIERADCDLPRGAALRCVWINVIEMLETGGIFDVAEQRQGMLPFRPLRLGLRGGDNI